MNDLLTDSFVSEANNGQHSRQSDIEMGLQVPRSNSDMGMEAFNKQIHEADKQIDKLSLLLQKLKEANEESKAVTKASAMKAIKKRMEKDIDEVGKIAYGVKTRIEAISKDNLNNRQKPGYEKGTGIDRARMNMTNALTKKFKDLMTEFQTLRQRIQDEYREVVERRVITVTGTRPDDETIDHLIETGNGEQIFQQAILEAGRGQVVSTVEEIQERHDAVKEIEKKLLDLHQIYLDMAVLVDAQGEILDNIESQVNNAVDHVQRGTSALQSAKKLQKNSRKWMCIAIIILLIIVAVIVVGVLKPWKSSKVTGTRPDDETIDHLIETGNGEQIFQQAILEAGRGQVVSTVEEIQERHDAVKEIEKKLLDLHQIYLDMAVLVDAQGEILDNIESQVNNAVDHVQRGTSALQSAKKLQKNSRKWMCIAIIILLIIVAVIVVGVLKPWKSSKGA
ncbi:hypothetical protein TanjilG_30298 [Lupinus angustifolius]|uniref:t-SNARE coiled-coil homology domain-containing protein n=1 Tax=Lupinus angustifolius TaxID=3871 RepID=A0A4P1R7Q4_LUPAN|nr:hypothetical protein TanjilG_30298 [Lupinus angustifolius]